MLFSEVEPESFINLNTGEPAHGRGAWNSTGNDHSYRYQLVTDGDLLGSVCEKSLAHWAVGAGIHAIQKRLQTLALMGRIPRKNRGVFDEVTRNAVREFQSFNSDPLTKAALEVDGTVGLSDARALFGPIATRMEKKYKIPAGYLAGQTNHESAFDPGAVGYFIFYPDYRGVDRGLSQINSKAHADISWRNAFLPYYSLKYSASRLRSTFVGYKSRYGYNSDVVLWQAALCSHNSPVNGNAWAKNGSAPNDQAATYVREVLQAKF